MLRNLIDNALRYAKSGVEVAARREAGEAVLTVSDDGPGIPPPTASGPSTGSSGSTMPAAGTRPRPAVPLGLAIVRAIARTHGGSASLEGAAPGLRAVVRLPAAPGPPAAQEQS